MGITLLDVILVIVLIGFLAVGLRKGLWVTVGGAAFGPIPLPWCPVMSCAALWTRCNVRADWRSRLSRRCHAGSAVATCVTSWS